MSYQESAARLPAEAEGALFVAIVEVCERSFFTFVESCPLTRFTELIGQLNTSGASVPSAASVIGPNTSGTPPWLKASVTFSGPLLEGTVEVLLPECLARWLVGSM